MVSPESTVPTAVPVAAKIEPSVRRAKPLELSTSPHSNLSEPEADNEQLDEVFSNPDTADLGYRSDGTGATSPGPNSPGPSSPLSRSVLTSALASKSAQMADDAPSTSPPALRLHALPAFSKPAGANGSDAAAAHESQPSLVGSQAQSPQTPTSVVGGVRRDAAATSARRHSANVASLPGPGALPAANDLPADPVDASTVSRLFAHPPAASPILSPASVASPPRTPGFSPRPGAAGQPLGSPTTERSSLFFRPSRSATRPSSPDARSRGDASAPLSPLPSMSAARAADRPTSSSSTVSGLGALSSPSAAAATGSMPLSASASASSQSIFERDIEHRDASHIMSKQEAIDVAIPSVLDDAVEAIIEDGTEQIEVVAPQTPAPPLPLSSVALSVHSNANSPAMSSAIPSPPVAASGQFEAPPGSMAAQIAERLAPRQSAASASDEVRQSGSAMRSRGGVHSPGSDMGSVTSLRSRSPQASASRGVREVLDTSPARSSRASASPTPGPHASLAAAVSQASRAASATASAPIGGPSLSQQQQQQQLPAASSAFVTPTATAFPSLPLPNPYRSSSPNLAALSVPMMTASMSDVGRPAASSLSIDGAIISGAEAASLDHSLDSLADVIAASDAEEAASPYVPRSPAFYNYASGASSPTMEKHKIRKGKGSGDGRINPPGGLGTMPGGLGVFDGGENGSLMALSSGAPSPSQEAKRRLSFFSYADIINRNAGEVMDFEGVVRQAAERDDLQHGYPGGHSKQASSASQIAGAGGTQMSRSASTSAADQRRTAGGARLSSISGINTPLRGRRDVLENQALSNRLESLTLANNPAQPQQ
ncbi:uncharacterized protein PFL1_04743 [Pseudozyma flocculosa PF-1]|uniref:Uncharacterized protein n=2 Tax=Pseudozyma flocculosa TaxID=84751 RepID=A0A5C3F490_9BASI|nr:uncharacterized protein PFL1_04743 [Pseudozyma flocculosa PF-1]EPQ27605.1 hypothetical protein PFL1_04743 [Pseudozyma flocculosa PF-1]SPO39268.1 uncharacterized protein PSFLO_04748 [Pseudozyma flocculosa]